MPTIQIETPPPVDPRTFTDATAAVDHIIEVYERNVAFLRERLLGVTEGRTIVGRVRAFYPQVSISTETYQRLDSRQPYGFLPGPGTFATTLTRPDIFRAYLTEQLGLLIRHHQTGIVVSESDTPIPIHFAFWGGSHVDAGLSEQLGRPLRDIFDVPDLAITDDAIVNGTIPPGQMEPKPLAPFTAPRIDYSLHRLAHYTATQPETFQNFVLFTNYQFYIDEFVRIARTEMLNPDTEYDAFIEPGGVTTLRGDTEPSSGTPPPRLPQMPAYHLVRGAHTGITMVNIGVGPSNAKTITDHIAVLRPHAWLMLGHCAGLRNSQKLGDYVLAHAYVREDHVLDADLPVWVPIPALAEIQIALEQSVAEITGLQGWDLKSVMRTGTVATIDNRNWELRDHREPVQRFSQSRAIALDMESATIAANGFRFRVPYGTLLCVSDKPLHGELKLPGMASEFYRRQVGQHLMIGIRTMEKLRAMHPERLHSRKLRSFEETAFQ